MKSIAETLPSYSPNVTSQRLSSTTTYDPTSYMERDQRKPGNYLVFDGGKSALPGLYITEEMCARLQFDLDSDKEVRICDHCDLLGGSGTGAVAAILLGRMGLPSSQAIEAYLKLEPALSVQPTKDEDERRRNTEAFKTVFTEVLVEAGFTPDTPMMDKTAPKTVVWALNVANLSFPQPIRSYRVRSAPGSPFTILEAACASIASPDKFLPVTVGTGLKKVVLVDATAGYANPTKELLQEAQRVYDGDAEVASIVSLGTGKGDILSLVGTGDEDVLVDAMAKMAHDSEQTHNEVHNRLHASLIYFRLNVERGLIGNMDPSAVHAHTSAYIQEGDTDKLLNEVVKSIKSRQKGSTLKDINSVTVVEITMKPRPSLVENFVGRENILKALETTHFSNRSTKRRKPAVSVLMGLGGSGKTQIALRFALDYEERCRNASVYFLNASSEAKLKADFELAIRTRDSASRSKSHDDAVDWFADRKDDWLIIMDNADDPSVDLFRYIPKSSHGNVIITSRNATHKKLALASSHHVEGLSPTDASTLILKNSSYPDNEVNRSYALLISKELGYLPLALAHAAAYISDHQCLSTYLATYRESRARFLSTKPALPEDYNLSVATTIQMSFDSISPIAREILALLSRLDATSIAHSIIETSAKRKFFNIDGQSEEASNSITNQLADVLMSIFCPNGEWLEYDFNDSVQQCLQYSLLQVATRGEARFYSMHVLVQTYLQSTSRSIRQHQPELLVIRMLGSVITVDYNYNYHAFNRLLVPHLKMIVTDHVADAGDHFAFGHVLRQQGNVRLSIGHLERCLALRRSNLGEEHPDTMLAIRNLASCHRDLGRSQEAMELEVKLVDLRKRISGDEHPETLTAINNLAVSYSSMGRYQEALELGVQVLETLTRILGDEHPDTLIAMDNLVMSYHYMGRYQEASDLGVKVLDLRKRISGDEHPETLAAMTTLAVICRDLEKYEDALELEMKALDLLKQVSGDEHPDTMIAMSNLAGSYSRLEQHQEALGLQEDVLEMRTRLSGEEHPDTLVAMWNLSVTLHHLGMTERAIMLLRAAIPLQEKGFGSGHPHAVGMKSWLDRYLKPSP